MFSLLCRKHVHHLCDVKPFPAAERCGGHEERRPDVHEGDGDRPLARLPSPAFRLRPGCRPRLPGLQLRPAPRHRSTVKPSSVIGCNPYWTRVMFSSSQMEDAPCVTSTNVEGCSTHKLPHGHNGVPQGYMPYKLLSFYEPCG